MSVAKSIHGSAFSDFRRSRNSPARAESSGVVAILDNRENIQSANSARTFCSRLPTRSSYLGKMRCSSSQYSKSGNSALARESPPSRWFHISNLGRRSGNRMHHLVKEQQLENREDCLGFADCRLYLWVSGRVASLWRDSTE